MTKVRAGLCALMLAAAMAGCSQETAAPPQLALQAILYPDFAQNRIAGNACAFVAKGGGMGAVFMALETRAVLKLADRIVSIPVAGDGSALPLGTHTHYAGPLYGVTLTRDPGQSHAITTDATAFTGRLTITDAKGQVVYQADGDAQCKPV